MQAQSSTPEKDEPQFTSQKKPTGEKMPPRAPSNSNMGLGSGSSRMRVGHAGILPGVALRA